METIKCRKCGKELPLDMFYKNKASENGYQTICKECWNEYIKTLKSKKESMGPVSCNNSRGYMEIPTSHSSLRDSSLKN